MELRPRVLAKLYLKSWFAPDLFIIAIDVGLILVDYIMGEGSAGSAFRSVRFLRSLRALRVLDALDPPGWLSKRGLLRLLRVAKLQRELGLLADRFLSTYVFYVLPLGRHILLASLFQATGHVSVHAHRDLGFFTCETSLCSTLWSSALTYGHVSINLGGVRK